VFLGCLVNAILSMREGERLIVWGWAAFQAITFTPIPVIAILGNVSWADSLAGIRTLVYVGLFLRFLAISLLATAYGMKNMDAGAWAK
jgi:hypothetical protein